MCSRISTFVLACVLVCAFTTMAYATKEYEESQRPKIISSQLSAEDMQRELPLTPQQRKSIHDNTPHPLSRQDIGLLLLGGTLLLLVVFAVACPRVLGLVLIAAAFYAMYDGPPDIVPSAWGLVIFGSCWLVFPKLTQRFFAVLIALWTAKKVIAYLDPHRNA